MDAADIKSAAGLSLADAGFTRDGSSRWYRRTAELLWVVELNRGRSWSAWAAMVGVVVIAWSDLEHPGAADGDVYVEYALLGDAVPEAAALSRFNDHRSYFTMTFDHRHDLIDDEERRAALAFMGSELRDRSDQIGTLAALRAELREDGPFRSGFVQARLRSEAE